MNYGETIEYINEMKKSGAVLGLDNIRALCAALGNPERELNAVHIAGTNGKGSTGAFIESALLAAGYSVCRYSSPAVFEYGEIFSRDGKSITRAELARYMTRVKTAADALIQSGKPRPTAFELETAMAFLYFRERGCDFAVIETGMGGRLDATNALGTPRVCVITPISLDHTAFLGGTPEEIAYEKAGIIKENGAVVAAPQTKSVMRVIERVCRDKNARLIKTAEPENIRGRVFDYGGMKDVEISLAGAFQPMNAAAAIEVCRALGIREADIRSGLKAAVWHGRFEKIHDDPVFIIDGAHNGAAAKMLAETIKTELSGRRLNFIIGVLADKDYDSVLRHTAHLADKIYAVSPDNPRALGAAELAEAARRYNINAEASDISAAVKKCIADRGAATVAFGSLSHLKDIKKAVQNETG